MQQDIDSIIQEIKSLPFDKQIILKRILDESTTLQATMEKYIDEKKFSDGRVCPYCGKHHIRRNGHQENGSQNFVCVDCNRSFSITTNTVFSGTSKSVDVWQKFIECMKQNLTLDECAEVCGVAHSTAFFWRHKILGTVRQCADKERLSGIVEAGETYVPISFKGNNRSFAEKVTNRPQRTRSNSVHKRGLSDDLVCIPSAIDRRGNVVAQVVKTGKVSIEALRKVARLEFGANKRRKSLQKGIVTYST